MNRLHPKPKIRLDDRFAPNWIRNFTLAITFGWACYGIYMKLLWPMFNDEPTPYHRYVEKEFPQLDVFDRRGGIDFGDHDGPANSQDRELTKRQQP